MDTFIDSGATQCFMDESFANENGFPIEPMQGQIHCDGKDVVEMKSVLTQKLQMQNFLQ